MLGNRNIFTRAAHLYLYLPFQIIYTCKDRRQFWWGLFWRRACAPALWWVLTHITCVCVCAYVCCLHSLKACSHSQPFSCLPRADCEAAGGLLPPARTQSMRLRVVNTKEAVVQTYVVGDR